MKWYVDVPTRNIIRIFGIVTGLLAVFALAYWALEALSILVVAAFLAIATHKPVSCVARYLPFGGRKLAAIGVFALIAVVAGFIVYLVIPLITQQGREIVAQIPTYIDSLRSGETLISQWLLRVDAFTHMETVLTGVFQGVVHSAEATIDLLGVIIKNVLAIFFTVLIGFALVVEGPQKIRTLDSCLSPDMRGHVEVMRYRVFQAVTGFVNGQLIITTISATLTFILLSLLGIQSPLSLAAVIWLTGLIPLIGNTMGAIIVIAIAFSQSLVIALFLIAYYVVYQQIENNVFEPIIQSRTVHLTPLTVLISAIIGVTIAGFAGALLAIPAGASIRVLIQYYFEQRGSPAQP